MNDDAVLHAAFVAQADLYARALELASAVAAAPSARLDDYLSRVFGLLDEIAAHEAALAPVKRRWQQAGRTAGAEQRILMDRIAVLIEQLGRQLQTIERGVRERRDRLAEELDACNRRRQMHRAYLGES